DQDFFAAARKHFDQPVGAQEAHALAERAGIARQRRRRPDTEENDQPVELVGALAKIAIAEAPVRRAEQHGRRHRRRARNGDAVDLAQDAEAQPLDEAAFLFLDFRISGLFAETLLAVAELVAERDRLGERYVD